MPKMTRDYQEGFCNICKQETFVRILVNTSKAVSVCKGCIEKIGSLTVNELLAKYGEDISNQAS